MCLTTQIPLQEIIRRLDLFDNLGRFPFNHNIGNLRESKIICDGNIKSEKFGIRRGVVLFSENSEKLCFTRH